MIEQSRAHLRQAGESYWQHFRFATTFGLLAMAAGFAALLHALIPGLCTSTASRIVRHLGQLLEDRSRIDAIESEAVEARAFVLLLILATAVVAPLWLHGRADRTADRLYGARLRASGRAAVQQSRADRRASTAG